jgi:NhaA family Na+:H+ antiporter
VAGIGFTVSLFVAGLSYHGVRLDDAKVAILAASVISGTVGFTLLRLSTTTSSSP